MALQDQRNLGKYAARGDAVRVQECLRAGADPSHVNSSGVSVLLRAVLGTYNPEVLRLLLDAGADPNRASRQDETPLMMALGMGRGAEAVEMLLAAGADVRGMGFGGYTVLHYALMSVDSDAGLEPVDSVRLVLGAGAPIDGGAAQEGSALMLACRRGCMAIAVELLEAGARIEERLREDAFWDEVAGSVLPRAARNAQPLRRLLESNVMSRAIGGAMSAPDDEPVTPSEPSGGSGPML